MQLPPEQVSFVVHLSPSLQRDPLGSASEQLLDASLHDSVQSLSLSPTREAQGSPSWLVQAPALHSSSPLQKRPSSQSEPFGSASVQLSAASLQDSAQLLSSSGPGHGLPV